MSVRDPQGVLLPGDSGLLPNGQHGVAQSPHVLIQSLPMRETLGVATSTNKKEVEVFPHVAEGSLAVLIDNSTVWTEGQLPAPSTNANLTASPGTHAGGSLSRGTPCPCPHASPEAPRLSS